MPPTGHLQQLSRSSLSSRNHRGTCVHRGQSRLVPSQKGRISRTRFKVAGGNRFKECTNSRNKESASSFTTMLTVFMFLLMPAVAVTLTDDPHNEALQFLERYLPNRDQHLLNTDYLQRNVHMALTARDSTPWAADVPWDVFLHDVLPHRHLDEPSDEWRSMFSKLMQPVVASAKSTTEAAELVNKEVWKIWGIHFKPDQTPEIMSASQVIAAGYASCTGLAIFLANACRAVGIPARVAGTPSWVSSDSDPERFSNHNWVEIWDTYWSFTGALEWDPQGMNRTWFYPDPVQRQIQGDKYHAVYAASYSPTPSGVYFPLVWNVSSTDVPAFDVTEWYKPTAPPT